MTAKDLDGLAAFTMKAMGHMQEVEIRQNIAGHSDVVIRTTHEGEKIVERFLTAAPINISCLLEEVRVLTVFIDKVLQKSIAQDGEPEHGASEVTQMLQEHVDSRHSVATTADPKDLMGKAAEA